MKCTATWLAIATASLLLVTGCNKRQEAEEPSAGEMEEMKRMEAQAAAKGKEEGKPQATCPVMGNAIVKDLFADVSGKRIYVCCKGCIAKIEKDPAKYIAKLEAEGVTLEDAPK